jgi:hypothetical protein
MAGQEVTWSARRAHRKLRPTSATGKGAQVEHVLGYWDRGGVRYAVCVHGTDADSRALLEEMISSIELVGRSTMAARRAARVPPGLLGHDGGGRPARPGPGELDNVPTFASWRDKAVANRPTEARRLGGFGV